MLKRATSLFNSFCSNVSRQVMRQRGRAVRALDLQFAGRVLVPLSPLAAFVRGSPEFKSSVTLVNSQLVGLRPVGILNPIVFD